jgi:hypothetical protein
MTRLGRLWDLMLVGREPQAALFCTYGFDARFFEAEVLPALFPVSLTLDRESGSPAAYLNAADSALPRTTVGVFYDHLLSGPELVYGSWRVDVAPRAFHPKLTLLDYGDVIRVAISSANLSRSGWSSQLELFVVEELRPGAAHPWSAGLARFCARLETHIPGSQRARFAELTANLRTVPPARGESPVRSSWDGPLIDAFLDGVHRARRMSAVTPFFEGSDGRGVFDELRDRLGLVGGALFTGTDDSHERPIINGPPEKLRALLADGRWTLHSVHKTWEGDEPDAPLRALHGKLLAVIHDDGMRLMVGSANLTRAALLREAPAGNVELVVIEDRTPGELREILPQATALDPNSVEIVDRGDPTDEDGEADVGPEARVVEATYRVAERRLELELNRELPALTFRYQRHELRGTWVGTRWSVPLELGLDRYITVSDRTGSGVVAFVIVDPEHLVPRGTAHMVGLEDFFDVLAGYRDLPLADDEQQRDGNGQGDAPGVEMIGARGAIPWRRYLAAVAGLGQEIERERHTARGMRYVIENPTRLAGMMSQLEDARATARFTRADLAYALYELDRELRRILPLETPDDARLLLNHAQEAIAERITVLIGEGGDRVGDQLTVLRSADRS